MGKKELQRLTECMRRAARGEELTIGFLGGSITQGSLASSEKLTYAYHVCQWWCKNFPDAEFHYVNGGIGGTNSHFGVARAEEDLLIYQPDVVIVDFSVNDEADRFCQETYEGVLRKLLSWESLPAVIVLNNVFYDTGENAQDYHNAAAKHYDVPCVSIRDSIYQQMKQGNYTRQDLTTDGLHPNDMGHRLVAMEITGLLEQARLAAGKCEKEAEICRELPAPITKNAYEKAVCLTIRNSHPKLSGFHADTNEKKGHLDFFKNGWIGKKKGDRICFEAACSCIAVQYRKTIQKPAPVARLILDGRMEDAVILDGNFQETWGDCLYLERILHHGVKKIHTVEIEIIQADEEIKSSFYLLSLITA